MLTNQQLFDNACNSLRTYGNPYGPQSLRGWAWVNKNNPNERCAIARFIDGESDNEVIYNLACELGFASVDELFTKQNEIVDDIVSLFDYDHSTCNNFNALETALGLIASRHNLSLSPVDINSDVLDCVAD